MPSRGIIRTCSSLARRDRRAPRGTARAPSSGGGLLTHMTVLFWISALIVAYVYAGYPCLLAVWARITNRRPRATPFADGRWPAISIVLAARNEAARLPARVADLLAQDYPGPREIL